MADKVVFEGSALDQHHRATRWAEESVALERLGCGIHIFCPSLSFRYFQRIIRG